MNTSSLIWPFNFLSTSHSLHKIHSRKPLVFKVALSDVNYFCSRYWEGLTMPAARFVMYYLSKIETRHAYCQWILLFCPKNPTIHEQNILIKMIWKMSLSMCGPEFKITSPETENWLHEGCSKLGSIFL